MKFKNIPADIKSKSIKDAQNEIKHILSNLENTETDLKKSVDQYDRMLQLNNYIQEKFRKKLSEIREKKLDKTKQAFAAGHPHRTHPLGLFPLDIATRYRSFLSPIFRMVLAPPEIRFL